MDAWANSDPKDCADLEPETVVDSKKDIEQTFELEAAQVSKMISLLSSSYKKAVSVSRFTFRGIPLVIYVASVVFLCPKQRKLGTYPSFCLH